MRTFSEIVDAGIATTKAVQLRQYAIAAANGVVRDLVTNHNSDFDLEEAKIAVPQQYSQGYHGTQLHKVRRQASSTTVTWKIPADFRSVRTVRFDGEFFIKNKKPGLVQRRSPRYWYQSGDTLCFIGANYEILLAYYRMTKTFVYYPPDKRLFRSNAEDQYQIRSSAETPDWHMFDCNDPTQEAISRRHINWVIRDYPEIILEGLISRLYNAGGDLSRGGRFHQTYVASKELLARSFQSHLGSEL